MTLAEYCEELHRAAIKVLDADNKYEMDDALNELCVVAERPVIRVKMGRLAA